MISFITTMLIATHLNVAEAHPRHIHRWPASHYALRPKPAPPPSARVGHNLAYHKNHWTYPHSNPLYIWKWKFGHYNRHGHWVRGHWSVVIRF